MKKIFEKIFSELPPFLVLSTIYRITETPYKEKGEFLELNKMLKSEDVVISLEDKLITVYTPKNRYRFTRDDMTYSYSWEVQSILKRIANKLYSTTEGEENNKLINLVCEEIAFEVFNYFNLPFNELTLRNDIKLERVPNSAVRLRLIIKRGQVCQRDLDGSITALSLLLDIIKMFSGTSSYSRFKHCARLLNWKINEPTDSDKCLARHEDPEEFELILSNNENIVFIRHTVSERERKHYGFDYINGVYHGGYDFIRGVLFLMR